MLPTADRRSVVASMTARSGKGLSVNPAKINDLFDILKLACARQFGFNPRQVAAGMRYVGKEGHAKDIVHIFRDAVTHSQIELHSTYVSLREKHGGKQHWTDAEKSHYKRSDAEIDAELAAHQAEIDYTRHSPLYLDHRAHLLAHYSAWPGHIAGGPTPREAARLLIEALAAASDPRLAAFAAHVGSNDPERLAHLLIAPCHLELVADQPT